MRRSNWTPVVVTTDRDSGRGRPEREWVNEQPPEIWQLTTAAQETQLRTDLAFSVGVALALALPAFLGIGVYVASFVLLRAS